MTVRDLIEALQALPASAQDKRVVDHFAHSIIGVTEMTGDALTVELEMNIAADDLCFDELADD
jgi:hypothetical protein